MIKNGSGLRIRILKIKKTVGGSPDPVPIYKKKNRIRIRIWIRILIWKTANKYKNFEKFTKMLKNSNSK